MVKQATRQDAPVIAEIISRANHDVAIQFGITQENNPKHPSFYTQAWAESDFERGEEYFLYWVDGCAVACIAFEQASNEVGYLNRLSVLPTFRRQGIGQALTQQIVRHGRLKGVSELSIGIIANHTDLKNWYLKLGFVENGIKQFPHLPFDVQFMTLLLT